MFDSVLFDVFIAANFILLPLVRFVTMYIYVQFQQVRVKVQLRKHLLLLKTMMTMMGILRLRKRVTDGEEGDENDSDEETEEEYNEGKPNQI